MITSRIRSWDKFSVGEYSYFLSDGALGQLKEVVTDSISWSQTAPEEPAKKLLALSEEILKARDLYLDNGPGFFVLNGLQKLKCDEQTFRWIFRTISSIIGALMPQNTEGETVVEVRDFGLSMDRGGRYHQTREEGGIHTDSPQWSGVPDYLGLLCLSPGWQGGACRLVSGLQVYNELLRLFPEDLKMLQQSFFFDKRGEYAADEEPTIYKPIMSFRENQLMIRYLRKYIDDGHQLAGSPLTPRQKRALDHLDELLTEDRLVFEVKLEAGQGYFANNLVILHGRREFLDSSKMKRLFLRTWLRKRLNGS